MYIDDIVNETNKEQSKYDLKLYNRESLTLPVIKDLNHLEKLVFGH